MLDPSFVAKHFPSRLASFTALPKIIRWYLSITDGECAVERLLGDARNDMKTHYNSHEEVFSDMLELKACSVSTADVYDKKADRLGQFGLACAREWRSIFGARLGIRRKIAKMPSKKKRASWTSRKQDMYAAIGQSLQTSANQERRKMPQPAFTAFGVKREELVEKDSDRAGSTSNRYWAPRMTKFARASLLR